MGLGGSLSEDSEPSTGGDSVLDPAGEGNPDGTPFLSSHLWQMLLCRFKGLCLKAGPAGTGASEANVSKKGFITSFFVSFSLGASNEARRGRHWGQALQYLDLKLPVEAGQRVMLLARRDGNQARWPLSLTL